MPMQLSLQQSLVPNFNAQFPSQPMFGNNMMPAQQQRLDLSAMPQFQADQLYSQFPQAADQNQQNLMMGMGQADNAQMMSQMQQVPQLSQMPQMDLSQFINQHQQMDPAAMGQMGMMMPQPSGMSGMAFSQPSNFGQQQQPLQYPQLPQHEFMLPQLPMLSNALQQLPGLPQVPSAMQQQPDMGMMQQPQGVSSFFAPQQFIQSPNSALLPPASNIPIADANVLQQFEQQPQQQANDHQVNVQTSTSTSSQFIAPPFLPNQPFVNPMTMMHMPIGYMPPPPGPAPYPFPSFNPPNYYQPSNEFVS
jgi:hypothetical protein